MAKRGADAASPDEGTITEIVEDVGGGLVWTVEQWGTMPLWRCSLCGWDTLDGEGAMVQHHLTVHAVRVAAAEPAAYTRYDRYGREVEREV